MRPVALFLICLIAPICSAEKPKQKLIIRAVTHAAQVNERHSTYVTPGTSNTTCNTSGNATAIGLPGMVTANGTATSNCQTTSRPAQVHEVNRSTVSVMNVVEADGLRYKIVCTAGWAGSNCSQMTDGEMYEAEIEGTTMWVAARRGGNQGKLMRVKYQVLDIRPVPGEPSKPSADDSGAKEPKLQSPVSSPSSAGPASGSEDGAALDKFTMRVEAAKRKYPDFDEIASRTYSYVTDAMRQAVFESELAGEIIYWLGQNPDECRRIAALSPTSTALEIGKLTAKLGVQN